MSDKFFIDSNVLVYAYDEHDTNKQNAAQSVLTESIKNSNGTVSTQVMGEFFTIVTKKIPLPLSADDAWEIVKTLTVLPVLHIDMAMVHRAIETHQQYRITYWDSLIIAAAERAGCTTVLTEDLQHGGAYHGIRVVNPFV
jgi:predicted nucleic acid-binding protein